MRVTVIIVTYHSEDSISRCLESLLAQKGDVELKVTVVDNASTDRTVEVIRNRFPQVELILNPTNRGFGAAVNRVLQKQAADFYLILNPDTRLESEAIVTLLKFCQKNSDVGIVGPKISYPDGKIQASCKSDYPKLFYQFFETSLLQRFSPNSNLLRKYHLLDWDHGEIRQVKWLMGAALFVRREVFEKIGFFDENFFLYYEDTDFCKRASQVGFKIIYFPEVKVWHREGQSTKFLPTFEKGLIAYKSLFYFYRKHYGRIAEVLLRTMVFLTSLIYILGITIKNLGRIKQNSTVRYNWGLIELVLSL